MTKTPKFLCLLFMLALITVCQFSFAQAPVSALKQMMNVIETYNQNQALEKLYVQTDKPAYNRGDTLWFKSYLFDAATLKASHRSGLMYIEIADQNDTVICRNMVGLIAGMGWGSLSLDNKMFPDGNYTLRAYSNWMRNSGQDAIFSLPFTVTGVKPESWLISSKFNVATQNNQPNVSASLRFIRVDNRPLIAEQLKAKITAGKSTLGRANIQTGTDGNADITFALPPKADTKNINISITKAGKNDDDDAFVVPVILNRDEKTDLQFMPEGGNLYAGLKNHVAFKAISEEGKGSDVSGAVFNNNQQQVAVIKSEHLGMGAFWFTPQAGETYTARIKVNGHELSYPLPAAKTSGLMLNVVNPFQSDSVQVAISPTADLQSQDTNYYLVAQARGVVCYGAVINPSKGIKTFVINKDAFPTGITRFTILNSMHQPVAERIIYINHNDNIKLTATPQKSAYGKRDSVTVSVKATDKTGNPLIGSFSLAVTDDAQVKTDPTAGTILTNILLDNDLKGYVENGAYYFINPSPDKTRQLDNLLLAQGWVNYSWTDAFAPNPPAPKFDSEPRFTVKGKVTNLFNKPVFQSHVLLLSKKPTAFADTVTNEKGEFVFNKLNPADSVVYILQAKNKKDKKAGLGIEVNEFKPVVFNSPNVRNMPWYVNMDTSKINAIQTSQAYTLEQDRMLGIHQLKQVNIQDTKIIKGSKNLNTNGGADFTMSEEDLRKSGRMTLKDLLLKNVKGFNENLRFNQYMINMDQKVHLVIDGVELDFFFDGEAGLTKREFYDQWLNYLDAQEIKGIEVMKSMRYSATYFNRFSKNPMDTPFNHAYIEITTYSGNGAFMKKTPGFYLYRPIVFASQREFYSPQYNYKKPSSFMDTRTTLYWTPNVITDKAGSATVRFYTGDKNGTYTFIMQGSDMDGNLGALRGKITVGQ